jgi:hypothetical protein
MFSNTVPQDIDITSLLAGIQVLATDVYPAVDTTDPTQSPQGSTKKYTIAQLVTFLQTALITFPTTIVTALSLQMVPNNRYISNNAANIILTLPILFNVGDILEIANFNGGFTLTQNANQNILFGSVFSSTGIGGGISSTAMGDAIRLVGVVANTSFMMIPGSQGNLTVT